MTVDKTLEALEAKTGNVKWHAENTGVERELVTIGAPIETDLPAARDLAISRGSCDS